jgi:ATP-dependent helicase HrpB
VLSAPPGAGKTTRVPLALLEQPWLEGRRIVMLEPRRLAARAAAAYMARLLDQPVGGTIGYRVRLDTRVSARTRVEVVTEGVLTRMLQDDPALDGTGVVVFDEFHERSIHADLGLALALQSQAVLRPDLRLLVMSATLDEAGVAALLDDAPVVRSEGRAHAVRTLHLQRRVEGHIEPAVASAVLRALDAHEGDILAFLPGAAEIRRTAERLEGAALPPHIAVMPLFGDLPQEAQDRAIAPSPAGRRKVVLATAIAETSLTIEGVRVVVDSGLMRVPRFSPRTGMTRLVTVPVSRAAADQRRGRAGRLGPGTCYRLWTEADDTALLAHRPPEIAEADLAPLALELAAWGVSDPLELRWIDPPPTAAFAQARDLLAELDALDDDGRITAHGRSMARLATHPRLAHMLLRAAALDDAHVLPVACSLAALLAERDILRVPAAGGGPGGGGGSAGGWSGSGAAPAGGANWGGGAAPAGGANWGGGAAPAGGANRGGGADPDVRLRLALLHGGGGAPHGHVIDRGALQRARTEARQWLRQVGSRGTRAATTSPTGDEDAAGLLLALAYPDRIGQRRGARGRFLLRNGRGAAIDPHHNLAGEEFIVAAEVGGHGRDSRVFLAAPLPRAELERHFAGQVRTEQEVGWDAAAAVVRAREVRRLGALVLGERPLQQPPLERIAAAWLDAIRAQGLELLPWPDDARRLRERLAFLHALDPATWPDVSDEALLASLDRWLLPWIAPRTDAGALRAIDPGQALWSLAGQDRRADVDRLAPSHIEVPSGSRVAIDYSDPAAPVLAVRLQEMFGLADTPRIGGGRVPVTLHLLSPARRPVQVTRDLASFWRSGYYDVRKDLRGRYPKHYWPDDPLQAEPTSRAKPRR